MTERIFKLPVRPSDWAGLALWHGAVARMLEAVPEDWSDVTGELVPATEDLVCEHTGYSFHRFDQAVRVTARQQPASPDVVVRPDPVAVLLSGWLPRFVSFQHTGYDAQWQFQTARRLAAAFVQKGFLGWLSFNNGRRRDSAHEIPAEVEFRLSPWERIGEGPRRAMPPAIALRWDDHFGGKIEQLTPILTVVQETCQELVEG